MSGTKQRLVEVAADLVDEGGPSAVTLREVGKRAGFSHNTPYKHFNSKEDLLAQVAAQELNTLTTAIQAAIDPLQGLGRIGAAAEAYINWARSHPARFKLTFGEWSIEHDVLGQAAEATWGTMYRAVEQALEEEPHANHNPDTVLSLLWALAHGAADLDLSGHLRKRAESPSAHDLVTTLLSTLTVASKSRSK